MAIATSRIVKLDYDNARDARYVCERLPFACRVLGIVIDHLWAEWSASGRGVHVGIVLKKPLPVEEIVLLQATLGSDWKRELFNVSRLRVLGALPTFWQQRWNVLYAEKLQENRTHDRPGEIQ